MYDISNQIKQPAFWLLNMLIFFSPFFRGLFFVENQRIALAMATIVFLLTCIYLYHKNQLKFFKSTLDYLVLALPLIYIISAFFAANYTLAINEVIETLLYFFIFWAAVRLIETLNDVQKVFLVIYFAATVVSLAGLLNAMDIIAIKDGFIDRDGGTIASTFQYKNALASFLIAAIFIGFSLWAKIVNNKMKYALLGGNFVLLTVLFATNSNGGYIIFAIFTILYWFLNPSILRLKLITGMLSSALFAYISSSLFLGAVLAPNIGLALGWLILGLLVTLAFNWLLNKYTKFHSINISTKHLLVIALILVVIALVAMFALDIHQALAEKIHMHGFKERLTMYEDGLKMVQDKPLLGWGGGGWNEAYRTFQSYGYTARENHSYFLTTAIETGLIGLAVVVAIWSGVLALAYKRYKKAANNYLLRPVIATVTCSILAILGHAALDFNLSLSALTITLYVLAACLVAATEEQNKEKPWGQTRSRYQLVAPVLITPVVIITIFAMIYSQGLTKQAVANVNQGDLPKAAELAEETRAFYTLNSTNYSLMSQINSSLGNTKQAVKDAEQAVKLASYNPDRQYELSTIYLKTGQNEKAIKAMQRAVELAPLEQVHYERLATTLTNALLSELKNNNLAGAQRDIDNMLAMQDQIKQQMTAVPADKKELWIGKPHLAATDKINLNIGIASLYNGQWDKANHYITLALNNAQLQNEAYVWQAVIEAKRGHQPKAEEILKKVEKNDQGARKQFEQMFSLPTVKQK